MEYFLFVPAHSKGKFERKKPITDAKREKRAKRTISQKRQNSPQQQENKVCRPSTTINSLMADDKNARVVTLSTPLSGPYVPTTHTKRLLQTCKSETKCPYCWNIIFYLFTFSYINRCKKVEKMSETTKVNWSAKTNH
ncbi:hypothetical protein AVEN_14628-1 [Araneus ventricosus]|uniref:Uncharacterized protein n=1 Tax=Araneus ventricosus TaxID=182803 RepID=A0A4Y2UUN5_ARAVE|nr:hypothetical protein AVEN_14628-1 [Araneus ventricosus]